MENFEYIDSYFSKEALPETKVNFEERLLSDKEFAEEVAFYLSMIQVAREQNVAEKKERFRQNYYENQSGQSKRQPIRILPYMSAAAAVLAAFVLGIYLYMQPSGSQQLADDYMKKHLEIMSVSMGNNTSQMELGKTFYNNKKYSASLQKFEEVIKSDTANYDAKENAGIVALQLKDYSKAIRYFDQLAVNPDVRVNFGKFYQALTLMKRNKTGDKEASKKILQQVIKDQLPGKEEAMEFLKNM